MPYLGEVHLQGSLNAIYASMRSFILNPDEEQLHLALAVLHATQITLYTQTLPNDTENQAKYASFLAIHSIFRETHRGIYDRVHARNSQVIQPRVNRDC